MAIMIRTGAPGKSAVDIGRKLVNEFNNVPQIKQLLDIESKPKRKIGFEVKEPEAGYGKKGNKSQTET